MNDKNYQPASQVEIGNCHYVSEKNVYINLPAYMNLFFLLITISSDWKERAE